MNAHQTISRIVTVTLLTGALIGAVASAQEKKPTVAAKPPAKPAAAAAHAPKRL